MTGVCSTTNAHLSSPMLSSAEVHVLGSHGMLLPKTPIADEVLADSFLSIDEGQDADFSTADDGDSECSGEDTETESTTAEPSITEDAAAFKKTRKNVKKRVGDRLPHRGKMLHSGPPGQKGYPPFYSYFEKVIVLTPTFIYY